jgi:hypothetical protein
MGKREDPTVESFIGISGPKEEKAGPVRMGLGLVSECLSYGMIMSGYHSLHTNPTYTPK